MIKNKILFNRPYINNKDYLMFKKIFKTQSINSRGGFTINCEKNMKQVFVEEYATSIANENWDEILPWSCFLEESTLVESQVPYESNAPVFILTGDEDDLVIAETVKDSIPQLCDLGYQIEYHQCLNLTPLIKTIQHSTYL